MNGLPGELILVKDVSEMNTVVWFDEPHSIAFSVEGTLEKYVILHIAESEDLSILTK